MDKSTVCNSRFEGTERNQSFLVNLVVDVHVAWVASEMFQSLSKQQCR